MEDNIVYFDKDTPKIPQANKVKSLLAVNGDDDTIGSVEFDLLVLEAGKNVSDAVKITGNVLPALGSANKQAKVFGGANGRILTYGDVDIEIQPNYEAILTWDGDEQTWEKTDETPLQRAVANGSITLGSVDAPSGEKVYLFTDPYFKNFKKSSNLLDKTRGIKGRYSASGLGYDSSANNWFSFPLLDLDELGISEGEKFILFNVKPLSVANPRFSLFKTTNVATETAQTVMSNNLGAQSTIRPVGYRWLGITAENTVGIGSNPSLSVFYDSMMLAKGDQVLPYESFGVRLDPEEYPTRDDISVVESAVLSIEEDTTFLMSSWLKMFEFNGVDSEIGLGRNYSIANPGDYVEFSAKGIIPFTYLEGLGMFGQKGVGSSQCLGFYDNTSIWLRTTAGSPYVEFSGLPNIGMNLTTYKVRLSDDASSFELYIDGVFNQSKPRSTADPLIVNNVGQAYSNSFSKFVLTEFSIFCDSTLFQFKKPNEIAGAKNLAIKYVPLNDKNDISLPPVFVSFYPTGYEGRELLVIYVRRGISDRYIGHRIAHEYNMDEVVYKDLFRIVNAHQYRYSDGSMNLENTYAIANGESECVYMGESGSIDHTGGTHGDELFQLFDFYIDGVRMDKTKGVELVPCNVAHYIQKSTTHKTAKGSTANPIPDPAHPIDAIHFKRTVFSHSQYETFNDLVWQRVFNATYWYHGICCLGKIQALKVSDEEFNEMSMEGSENMVLQKVNNRFYDFFNVSTGLGAEITSKLESSLINDSSCTSFIWDRANDSKYYRRTPAFQTVIGNKDRSYMKVTYR